MILVKDVTYFVTLQIFMFNICKKNHIQYEWEPNDPDGSHTKNQLYFVPITGFGHTFLTKNQCV